MPSPAKALTIAGSDSGGAAGLQADLKTFTALGVYGMSVVTVVTAQNSVAVHAVQAMPPQLVAGQLDAVLSDYGADAVKSGFIGRTDLIETIAGCLVAHQVNNLVVDPVLVNHRGEAMFPTAVVAAYHNHLLPLACLVTPNRREAELLAGMPVVTPADMQTAAQAIYAAGATAVLVKGVREGDDIVDLLFDGRETFLFRSPWLDTANSHGSGDTLSAAIVAYLAQGVELLTAVRQARHFTYQALQTAVSWRLGRGHGPLNHLFNHPGRFDVAG
jgi:hydroxymethylpyrimidine/phosphomethylpyrimidine kinase